MEGMDFSHLTQDIDQWQAVMNMIMNLWFHKMLGVSGVAEQLLYSKKEPDS
jgi:hypothetical protein